MEQQLDADDTFHCTARELEEFQKGRVWREIQSWIRARSIEARSNVKVADIFADDVDRKLATSVRLMEADILEELLELPEMIMHTMELREQNADIDEKEKSAMEAAIDLKEQDDAQETI